MTYCKRLVFVLALLGAVLHVYGQGGDLSPLSKISILTVGTGNELSSKFGHSAIRLQDPALGLDEVYNYGLFNFNDPQFYVKFTRGKLDYAVGRYPYSYFERDYREEKRWIAEQTLALNLDQRKELVLFLENNIKPENRFYKYDFLFENCATKIPEVLQLTLGQGLHFNYDHVDTSFTFRQLIRENLNSNTWSNFGIDLALGAVIDRKATPHEYMFLPLYVQKQLRHTTLDQKPLVKQETTLLDIPAQKDDPPFFLTPAFWLAMLLLLVIWGTYKDHVNNRRTKGIDILLFSLTGLAGVLILFLWFLTDHSATKQNYNALWAFAPNLVMAFVVAKNTLPQWLAPYLVAVMGLLGITLALWLLGVQSFSWLIILVLLTLGVRYGFLYRFISLQKK